MFGGIVTFGEMASIAVYNHQNVIEVHKFASIAMRVRIGGKHSPHSSSKKIANDHVGMAL